MLLSVSDSFWHPEASSAIAATKYFRWTSGSDLPPHLFLYFILVTVVGGRPKPETYFLPARLRWTLLLNKERYGNSLSGRGSNTHPSSWEADPLTLSYRTFKFPRFFVRNPGKVPLRSHRQRTGVVDGIREEGHPRTCPGLWHRPRHPQVLGRRNSGQPAAARADGSRGFEEVRSIRGGKETIYQLAVETADFS